jgi:hypothetical protein
MGVCTHFYIDEIKNGFERVIGGQCRKCLAVIWGVGKCAGCAKDNAKLTYTLDESRRYCGHQCRTDQLERERKAAQERARLKAPATRRA